MAGHHRNGWYMALRLAWYAPQWVPELGGIVIHLVAKKYGVVR